mmetsp:Transcript_36071/g.100097  ORF Transcript_36071/g.100097 Transcript_36071/m.100097 type:complete len:215 (+) Transcript_36071:1450-2094(+)
MNPPHEGLRPDPDPLRADVHTGAKAEASGHPATVFSVGAAFEPAAGPGQPGGQVGPRANAPSGRRRSWLRLQRWGRGSGRLALLVPEEAQEEVQEERLASAESTHDRDHGNLLGANLFEPCFKVPKGFLVHLHAAVSACKVQRHKLQRSPSRLLHCLDHWRHCRCFIPPGSSRRRRRHLKPGRFGGRWLWGQRRIEFAHGPLPAFADRRGAAAG